MHERLPFRAKQEPKKFGAILERPDLFETKVLKLNPLAHNENGHEILCTSRDPGSAAALIPVMQELTLKGERITCVTDGRGEEAISKQFNTHNVTAIEPTPVLATEFTEPNLVLIDPSFSEFGIDIATVLTFQTKPIVLLEDSYATANRFLVELKQRNITLPEKICVLDAVAQQIILDQFPELEGHIEVTGQPAFDQFANEPTAEIAAAARAKLNIPEQQRVFVVMSTPNEGKEFVEQLAKGLSGRSEAIIFRRHPRDNTTMAEYNTLFATHGVQLTESDQLSTTEAGALADCVITTTSVEGLHGIYRRKPVVYCYDANYVAPREGLVPPPAVRLGAAFGVDHMEQFADTLNRASLTPELQQAMEVQYPLDGKNAERVANVVQQLLFA